MLYLPKNAAYRKLFASQIASLSGTGLTTVALALLAYDLAGAAAGTVVGLLFAIKMVANVGLAPLAVAATGGLSQSRVLVLADGIRLVAACFLPFAHELWHIFALVFVLQAGAATYTPTFQATIPMVLEDERDYTHALSLSRLAYDIEAVVSPLIAAGLLLVFSTHDLFFGTALGFAGSALLVLAAKLPRSMGSGAAVPGTAAPFRSRAHRGVRLMAVTAALRPLLSLNLAVASAGAYVLVLTVVVVRNHFGCAESMVPLVLACMGLGSAVSAIAVPRFIAAARRNTTDRSTAVYAVMLRAAVALACTLTCVGATLAVTAGALGLYVVAGLWFAVGCAWAAAGTPMSLIIQRHTAKDDLASVFAAQYSLSHACWLVTYPLAGALGTVSVVLAAFVLAAITLVATIVAWWMLRGSITPGPVKGKRPAPQKGAARVTP